MNIYGGQTVDMNTVKKWVICFCSDNSDMCYKSHSRPPANLSIHKMKSSCLTLWPCAKLLASIKIHLCTYYSLKGILIIFWERLAMIVYDMINIVIKKLLESSLQLVLIIESSNILKFKEYFENCLIYFSVF